MQEQEREDCWPSREWFLGKAHDFLPYIHLYWLFILFIAMKWWLTHLIGCISMIMPVYLCLRGFKCTGERAWGFLFAYMVLLLFQGLTLCFICIIVITCVGRRLAAAPGNYQMKTVFFPSSLFCCESLKLPSRNTLHILGELQLWRPCFP